MIQVFEASEFLSVLAWKARRDGESSLKLSYETMTNKLSTLYHIHPEVRIHMGLVDLVSFERQNIRNIKVEYFDIEVNNLQSAEMKHLLQNNLPSESICKVFLSL